MGKVKKAGCILVNVDTKEIALVYREKQNDYSFPKGHLEENESLLECAIRETAEETKREASLLIEEPIYIENYVTTGGEDVELYYYLAKDNGSSDNDSEDTHPTFWIKYEDVREKLSYDSLKKTWDEVKDKVLEYCNKK